MRTFPAGSTIGVSSNGEDSDMGVLRVIRDDGDTLFVRGTLDGKPWEGEMPKDGLLTFDEQSGEYVR